MKIMVSGANGQLGSDICSVFSQSGHQVIALNHADFDLSDSAQLQARIHAEKADVLINTAAYHHVDLCEQNPEIAAQINVVAVQTMAENCAQIGTRFIHISTDYVFDGSKKAPYIESDIVHPLNVYGKTKAQGEELVCAASPKHVVLRVSAIYGMQPCRAKNGLNFVQLMLKLAKERGQVKVVDNEFVSPTCTRDIAKQLVLITETPQIQGIVHATSEGFCSWNEFAREIFDYSHTKVQLDAASSSDFPAKVPRPDYSVLENAKLKAAGIQIMPHWKDALHAYLDEYLKN